MRGAHEEEAGWFVVRPSQRTRFEFEGEESIREASCLAPLRPQRRPFEQNAPTSSHLEQFAVTWHVEMVGLLERPSGG